MTRVAGAVHTTGNILFSPADDRLFSAIGNRVAYVDLKRNASNAVGNFEARMDVDRLALSGDGVLLVAADVEGRLTATNVPRRCVLHRLHLKARCRAMAFSHDDGVLAVTHKRLVQLWLAPARRRRELAPFTKLQTFGGATRDATCLRWSRDSTMLACGSDDTTVRVYLVSFYGDDDGDAASSDDDAPTVRVTPYVLAAHRDAVVGAFWGATSAGAAATLVSCARDCVVVFWDLQTPDEAGNKSAKLGAKHFLWSDANDSELRVSNGALVAVDQNAARELLVAAFSGGVFAVYETSGDRRCACVHRLSVARGEIDAIALDRTGERIAMGSKRFGQLVVWEWRSETFALKQQGHDHEATCVAWSPDGRVLASGSSDRRVKLWADGSGFCFATMDDHAAPVTALAVAKNVVFSASLDGTVRAYDLRRYRNFRTFRTPPPRSSHSDAATRSLLAGSSSTPGAALRSLAVDADAEVVCAGSDEPFEIYVWSVRSGKILDALANHAGPVCCLALDPTDGGSLASGSWDKTVRLWNVFRNEHVEKLEHPAEVLAIAWRRDGGQLVAACLDGALHVWEPKDARLLAVVDATRDLERSDRFLSKRPRREKPHFTSVAFSVDGATVLAGGNSRFVCVYAVAQKVLVAKFRVSNARDAGAVDGASSDDDDAPLGDLDEVKHWRDAAGAGNRRAAADDDDDDADALPGAKRSRRAGAALARAVTSVAAVAFAPTGNAFVAATPGALLFFTRDDAATFAPFDVDENVTTASCLEALEQGDDARATAMALQLGDAETLNAVVAGVRLANVDVVVRGVPPARAPRLLEVLAARLDDSPHFEFFASWIRSLLHVHADALRDEAPALRAAHKAMLLHHRALLALVDDNDFALSFLDAEEAPTVDQDEAGES